MHPVCADVIQTIETWTPPKMQVQKRKRGNQGTKSKVKYIDLVTAFDIETTRIKRIEQSVMYVWQWQMGTEVTLMGRTWAEFLEVAQTLVANLEEGVYVVVYVHNLSYEFQFLRGIYDFDESEVFALDRRKVLKCTMFGHLELRCSYLHSNMNLDTYTKKMGAYHTKLAGEYDYNKERYYYTPLSDREVLYCVNDVRGLVEALLIEMEHDGDNLYTIPLTSTGYVRRDTKRAVRKERRELAKQIVPTYPVYKMLREAFRGGNTHANRRFANKTIRNVQSWDRSSSYPDVLCNCRYPITEFLPEEDESLERLAELIEVRHKAVLFRVALYNVEVAKDWWGCPYLAKDKCRNIQGAVIDNGRILSADYLETTVTDIDWQIIMEEYTAESIIPFDIYSARYGFLPRPIIDTNIQYYKAKTELKNVPDQELLYMKSKNKLNSIYGMMAQNPVRDNIVFRDGEFVQDMSKEKEQLLDESNSKCFLAYQWGVWCTAWARYRLEEGIRLAGEGFIYCDTDSVKFIGNASFTAYNRQRIKESKAAGAYATDPQGITHYMGVYEQEDTYEEFRTMGAKKYCYLIDGKLHATIAGVSKRDGGQELERAGGIEAFKEGFIFRDAGGTESVYNDNPDMTYTLPNGETIQITANVVIRDSTYTLGLSAEYERLLNYYQDFGNPFDFSIDEERI